MERTIEIRAPTDPFGPEGTRWLAVLISNYGCDPNEYWNIQVAPGCQATTAIPPQCLWGPDSKMGSILLLDLTNVTPPLDDVTPYVLRYFTPSQITYYGLCPGNNAYVMVFHVVDSTPGDYTANAIALAMQTSDAQGNLIWRALIWSYVDPPIQKYGAEPLSLTIRLVFPLT